MSKFSVVVALAAFAALTQVQPAQAGCVSGAVVGGVAGHMVGHGGVGAAAGCAVGHHRAATRARDAQNTQQTPPSR